MNIGLGMGIRASKGGMRSGLIQWIPCDEAALTATLHEAGAIGVDAVCDSDLLLLGRQGIYLAGAGAFANIYSANLSAMLNPDECSFFVRAKMASAAVWTDGAHHRCVRVAADDVNTLTIRKDNINNSLRWSTFGQSGESAITTTDNSDTDWMQLGFSRSYNHQEFTAWKNGVLKGTKTAVTPFSGAFAPTLCNIGSLDQTPANVWNGWLSDVIITLNGVVAGVSDHSVIASAMQSRTLSSFLLDNLFGAGNWAWWSCTDIDVHDESGQGNHARGALLTPGADGMGDGRTSFSFDGSGDYLQLWSPSLRDAFTPNSFSLSCWIYANSTLWSDTNQRAILTLQADASNRVLLYKRGTGATNVLQFLVVRGGTSTSVDVTMSGTGWHHIALTAGGGSWRAWLDATPQSVLKSLSGTWTGNLAATTTVAGAAQIPAAAVWVGRIAHIRLHNRPLVQAELARLVSAS